MISQKKLEIVSGYRAGAIGRVVQLHGEYYAQQWDVMMFFEAKVAQSIGDLFARFDPEQDGLWLALDGELIVGSIAIDGSGYDTGQARLRFFTLDPLYHGLGAGGRLMDAAMDFCRVRFQHVFLTTVEGLDAARYLYEKHGFALAHEEEDNTWGIPMVEQRFDWYAPKG